MTARKKTGGRKSTKSSSSRKRTSRTSSSKSAGSTKKSAPARKKSTSVAKRASTKRSPVSPAKRRSSSPATGEHTDPKGRGLRGVSGKEERMYEHIKKDAQASGRYGKRAKEVAARTVMKMHQARGHRRGQ